MKVSSMQKNHDEKGHRRIAGVPLRRWSLRLKQAMWVGLSLLLIAFAGSFWIERLKTDQANRLNGVITHQQSALASLDQYASYLFNKDPDHDTPPAYDVMTTTDIQYLWSYRQLRWVPLCYTQPTPCLGERGSIFLRKRSIEEENLSST